MIARIWHGKTKDSAGDEYFDYLEKTGIKDSLSTEGNRGVYVWSRMLSISKCCWHQKTGIFIMKGDSDDV